MKQTMKRTGLVLLFLVVVSLILGGVIGLITNKLGKTDQTLVIPKDTAVVYRGDTARSQAITTSNPDDLLALQSKDSLIGRLQGLVKQYRKELASATVVKATTAIEAAAKTDMEIDSSYYPVDTPEYTITYPTYKSSLKDKWYTADITAKRDSIRLKLSVYNEYSVVVGNDKGKWYADVLNHNPYTTTNFIRAIQIVPPKIKPKRFSVGATIGYGVVPEHGFQPFIGAGITYSLFSF